MGVSSTECSRFDKKQQKGIQGKQPRSVPIYNKFRGSVDKTDMLFFPFIAPNLDHASGITELSLTCLF